MGKIVFISYLDDNDNSVSGYFELVAEREHYVKVKNDTNILTIPYKRIKKIKERINNNNYKEGDL